MSQNFSVPVPKNYKQCRNLMEYLMVNMWQECSFLLGGMT